MSNSLLARAARFPLPNEYFELAVPQFGPLWLHAPSVPLIYWAGLGAFEPEVVAIFLERASRARVVVDVGANVGVFSLLAWRANPAAQVIAVEPNPVTANLLRATVERNRASIEVMELALSDRPATAQISLQGGLSSIVREPPRDVATTSVSTACFDDVIAGAVDLVKIDAEGAELMVLRGMIATLRQSRPAVICEFGADTLSEASSQLADAGYEAYSLPQRQPVDLSTMKVTESVDLLLLPIER
jgi:FkbM family methyltransferase